MFILHTKNVCKYYYVKVFIVFAFGIGIYYAKVLDVT